MPNPPEPKSPPPEPKPWLDGHHHCPCCAALLQFQVTPSFSRILFAQCRKCGWGFDIENLRKLLKTEHFKDPNAIKETPALEDPDVPAP